MPWGNGIGFGDSGLGGSILREMIGRLNIHGIIISAFNLQFCSLYLAEAIREKHREEEKLHKNYEEMARRVCKMESVIQSLKTGMHGLETERTLTLSRNEEELKSLKANHGKEIQKYEEKLSKLSKESNEMREENQRFQNEVGKMIDEMREIGVVLENEKANNAEHEARIEKLVLQKDEVCFITE